MIRGSKKRYISLSFTFVPSLIQSIIKIHKTILSSPIFSIFLFVNLFRSYQAIHLFIQT